MKSQRKFRTDEKNLVLIELLYKKKLKTKELFLKKMNFNFEKIGVYWMKSLIQVKSKKSITQTRKR